MTQGGGDMVNGERLCRVCGAATDARECPECGGGTKARRLGGESAREAPRRAPRPAIGSLPSKQRSSEPSPEAPGHSRGKGRSRAPSPEDGKPFTYDGEAGELFVLYLKNLVLTLVTLGVYRFWAKVEVQQFIARRTQVMGERFDYHATGRERFLGFLKGLLLLLPVIVGLTFVFQAAEERGGPKYAVQVLQLSFFVVLWFLRPLIIVGRERFRLSRTSWRSVRGHFDGRLRELFGIWLLDTVLMVCTLGIYTPWHHVKVRRWVSKHSHIGSDSFAYDGRGRDVLGINLAGYLLSVLTLGLYSPWWTAELMRYRVNHTQFAEGRFRSTLRGSQLFLPLIVGLPLTVLSLGLAIPFLRHLVLERTTNAMAFLGMVDLSRLQTVSDPGASALADGFAEAGDAITDVANVFGA